MPVASLRPVPLSLTALAAPEKPCDTFLPDLRTFPAVSRGFLPSARLCAGSGRVCRFF